MNRTLTEREKAIVRAGAIKRETAKFADAYVTITVKDETDPNGRARYSVTVTKDERADELDL